MDIGLLINDEGYIDAAIQNGDLAPGFDLQTGVFISLFTDRRSLPDDPLPDESGYLGGWWGDSFPDVDGDLIGSRLWLLQRSAKTTDTLMRANEYLAEAVQWLIDDGVVSDVSTNAQWHPTLTDCMTFQVLITKPDSTHVPFKYDFLWQQLKVPFVATTEIFDS